MSIATSTKGVVDYLQRNDTLMKQIVQAGESTAAELKQLVQKLDTARQEARDLIDVLGTVQFKVAKSSKVKAKQQGLLEEITNVSKDIQRFKAHPQITALLYAQRSELYLLLANTFTETVGKVVSFTPQEVDDLNVLLRRSRLDVASRKKHAHVLDSAVQLAKLAFRVAAKLASV